MNRRQFTVTLGAAVAGLVAGKASARRTARQRWEQARL